MRAIRKAVRSSVVRWRGPAAIAVTVSCAIGLSLAGPASANTPITAYSAQPSNTQAGGHPDVEIYFAVANRVLQHSESACNCEDAKNAVVHLPPGFIGNPHATPQCSIAEFSADECPIDSQVGIVNVSTTNGFPFNSAVYNLIPPPNEAGLLAFKIFLFNTPQFTVLSARTGSDYGLDATATSIYHGVFPLQEYRQDLWGVPADPSHNPLRLNSLFNPNGVGTTAYGDSLCDANGSASTDDPNTVVKPCTQKIPPSPSNTPPEPFLQDPTTCTSPLSSSLDILSYDGGTSNADDAWPQMVGCDQLGFNPSLFAQPTTTDADSASGVEVNLSIPQELSPTLPSPTELRGATITLPPGFSINPNAADGKTSCSDLDANFGTTLEANCPETSKVGSLEIDSSALPGPLPGFVYLGEPQPGNRYRIFLVANGFATHIKLAGTATPNPTTGQLTISFKELPQSPLTSFNMHFFGSERGLLATPTQCGTYPVTSTFEPWDSSLAALSSEQFFSITSGPYGAPCPGAQRPFNPGFIAASKTHTPGAHAPFSLELTRQDGDQFLSSVNIKTPPGFLATLSGVAYCSDAALAAAAQTSYTGLAELANPSCPLASQIGTSVTGAGAGNHPVYVPGTVYLAGPYKGAPLSLALITPAVSGPYDLGNVVVRVALHVDPATAQITAVSDLVPQILQGIPLRLRSIRVNLDRPEFTLNPTNCSPFAVNAEVHGDQGAVANLSQHFQVANCGTMPFEPELSMQLTGGTKRTQNPAFTAVLNARPGESHISSVAVSLPRSELLDNAHINSPCTRVQFAAEACPPGSLIGHAVAETPLLEAPLSGPVYLRSAPENKSGLPDVVAVLKGQIEIDLDGKVDTVNKRLRTTFGTVPDAPVTRFTLSLEGGSKGLLQNDTNICKAPQVATETILGQNGRNANTNATIKTPCKGKAKHHRHASRSKRRHR